MSIRVIEAQRSCVGAIKLNLAVVLSLVTLASLAAPPPAKRPKTLGTAPIDPAYLTQLGFGACSHWIQPWRAYLETMPASQFLNGVGLNFNPPNGSDYDQLLQMCAKNGVRTMRVEMAWSSLEFEDDTKVRNAKDWTARLTALHKYGVRPLILLNAHHGAPCPYKFFSRVAVAAAAVGAREVELDKVDDLVIGHSGINYFGDNSGKAGAAHYLITAIQGRRVTLSQPLTEALVAGGKVNMATLKYAPFGSPADPEGRATLDGWKRYAQTVARFAAEAMGTAGQADTGFDLEVWNELTFGSRFLNRKNYYVPLPPGEVQEVKIGDEILKATSEAAAAEPALFKGVRIGNGFANQTPFSNPSEMPAGIAALDKHPYPRLLSWPKDLALFHKGKALDAEGMNDTSGWDPSYEVCFPEYFASALQTETLMRDMAPFTTEIYRKPHGRFSRNEDPKTPCWIWMTEINMAPYEVGVSDRARALALKAKIVPRLYCFFLNKGVEKLELYALYTKEKNADTGLGLLYQDWVDQTKTNKTYPADDAEVTPLALKAVGRIAAKLREGLDPALVQTRQLGLTEIADTHNHFQFAGEPNGKAGHPPLYNRDVFAFLPYQVNAKKFVIPFYVMTRDIRQDLPAENFELTITGIRNTGAKISMYDPLLDRSAESKFSSTMNSIKVTVNATDYPRLLIVEEK